MIFACVSAANIEVARKHSASVFTCEMVRNLLLAEVPQAQVTILPLIDADLKPCRMCGQCCPTGRCAHDEDFNRVFRSLSEADGIFFVVPHYAPLPSKLMILLEKMQEIAYLHWCADPSYRFPLAEKPVGVIGHGGQESSAQVLEYYQRALVEPVANALRGVAMRVIGADDARPNGATFGIRSLVKPAGSIFVRIEHDWDLVRQQITPLVRNVAAAVH